MKKIFQLLVNAASNLHNINAGIEKAYRAWQTFYDLVAHLGTGPAGTTPVAVAQAAAEAVADSLADEQAAPAQPAVSL